MAVVLVVQVAYADMRSNIDHPVSFTGRKRKTDDGEDIGSSRGGDLVTVVKKKMADAGENDEKLIAAGKPATKKLLLLPFVVKQMRTKPLMLDFLDQNILKEIAIWLSPDPDRKNTLPNIKIRDQLLGIVDEVSTWHFRERPLWTAQHTAPSCLYSNLAVFSETQRRHAASLRLRCIVTSTADAIRIPEQARPL